MYIQSESFKSTIPSYCSENEGWKLSLFKQETSTD
jgi:hypothetical protein